MTDIPKFTVVLALDEKTIEQLRISIWTWYLNSPILWEQPWLISYDHSQISATDISEVFNIPTPCRPNFGVKLRKWDDNDHYQNQREKQLTSFVYAAECVETDWWLKLDTDCIAKKDCGDWIDSEWFEPDETGEYNAWIASPWHYTKGPHMQMMDKWAAKHPIWDDRFPPLDIPHAEGQKRFPHPRMASWISFYNTEWTQTVSYILRSLHDGQPLSPIPSQDGLHFYWGERSKLRTCKVKFKKRGWTNTSKLENIKIEAEKALQ